MKGNYTLKLTSRHEFPEEAKWNIFDTHTVTEKLVSDERRIDLYTQQAEKRIPKDCKNLRVYMSGFKMYQLVLLKVCKRRGIRLTMIWKNHDEDGYTHEQLALTDYKARIEQIKALMIREGFDIKGLRI